MHIALLSADTRGGVEPYAALALGLGSAGHDIRLVSPADFAPDLRGRGIEVRELSGSISEAVRSSGVAEMGGIERARFMQRWTARNMATWAQEMLIACGEVDLVVGGVGGLLLGRSVAEKLRLPVVEAHLQPLGPPTAAFPGVFAPRLPAWAGDAARRASHRLNDAFVLPFLPTIRRVRREVLGLPARARSVPAPRASLYGYSTEIVPEPPEWGDNHHVTGYWFLETAPEWSPTPELEAFLDAGPPPVCIGFGSMTSEDPAALGRLTADAARRVGVRAVLLSGWGGLDDPLDATDGDIHVTEYAPHDWLLPRCAAVVHHGGAGTTGAGLRAGIPTVAVPFGVDQPFWGARVAAIGVGPPAVPRRRLTTDRLAEALRHALTDPDVTTRAGEVGRGVRAEDGVATAVTHIERIGASLGTGDSH